MIIDPSKNTIVSGDNLEWLKWLPDRSIDLCYIDPPFFSNRDYEVIWGNGYEIRSFGDRFAGGISHYIEWMRPRLELIHAKLKDSGSIFLHCDWHASHRLRTLLDEIFKEQFFRSEIVWRRTNSKGLSFKGYSNNHDIIYYYTKSANFIWNRQFKEHDPEYVEKFYRHVEEKTGRRYRISDLTNPNQNRPNLTYKWNGHLRVWRWTKERMEAADKAGLIYYSSTGLACQKRFLDEMEGQPVDTIWDDILPIQAQSKERLGYPTQKPEALLKRIIESASNPGDIVLDCFGGGGTTAKVSSQLNRRFVVGDVSPVAVKIMSNRMNIECPHEGYEVKNLPQTVEEFQNIDGHKFAALVCDLMGWQCNDKKSSDGGIDGWDGDKNPIQIKNHSTTGAGRPDIQKFHSAIIKQKRKKGIFVAWQFARTALEYIAQIKGEHGIEIIAKPCSEIFGDLVIPHDKAENIRKLYAERLPEAWKGGKLDGRSRSIDSPSEVVALAVDRQLEDRHKAVLAKIAKVKSKGAEKKDHAKKKKGQRKKKS